MKKVSGLVSQLVPSVKSDVSLKGLRNIEDGCQEGSVLSTLICYLHLPALPPPLVSPHQYHDLDSLTYFFLTTDHAPLPDVGESNV